MRKTPPKTRATEALAAIDEVLETPTRPRRVRLPEPLQSYEDAGEPRSVRAYRNGAPILGELLPISTWFDGTDRERSRRVGAPIGGREVERVPTTVADRRVLSIIIDRPWRNREQIDVEYDRRHGPYPGRSTYNSIWRLRRDGLVERFGHEWGLTPAGREIAGGA